MIMLLQSTYYRIIRNVTKLFSLSVNSHYCVPTEVISATLFIIVLLLQDKKCGVLFKRAE